MSNSFFFGVEIKPSTLYRYNVSQQVEFTMATLKNAKNSGQRTVIYMELNNTQFTICSLITEKLEQQVLNLKVQKGVQIKIWSNGPNSIQLLGTYYKDTSDKQNGPLEQLSVQTALIGDDDVIYYPMTKDEHTALLQYNSDEAVAEREEFVGKFGVVMDILESIENPQPILDGFMSKYKDSKKRGLEDIERILSPKKHKKMEESTKVNASKEEVEQSTPKTTAKKPVENTVSKQNPPKKKQTITKPDMESKKKHATTKPDIDSKKKQNTVTKPDIEHKKKRDTTTKPDINNKKKQQNMNKKKNAKKSPNGIQKTPSHSKSTPKPTHKKSPSKIEIPQ